MTFDSTASQVADKTVNGLWNISTIPLKEKEDLLLLDTAWLRDLDLKYQEMFLGN